MSLAIAASLFSASCAGEAAREVSAGSSVAAVPNSTGGSVAVSTAQAKLGSAVDQTLAAGTGRHYVETRVHVAEAEARPADPSQPGSVPTVPGLPPRDVNLTWTVTSDGSYDLRATRRNFCSTPVICSSRSDTRVRSAIMRNFCTFSTVASKCS